MQKIITAIVVVALLLAVIITILEIRSTSEEGPVACTMDAKMCPDGSAVGRVGPQCEFAECPSLPEVPRDVQAQIDAKRDLIVLREPRAMSLVSSPITIVGEARGTWFFEASFPIVIVDWDGRIIGEGHATADGEWMTPDFVPFTATVTFDLPADTPYRRGAIILKKDNPSGLPEHDDALEIPINF